MKADRTVLVFALLTLILCFGASSTLHAQDPRGSELRVNQRVAGSQWWPDVATAADGSFVVVWMEDRASPPFSQPISVKARLFDATGKPRSRDIEVSRIGAPLLWTGPAVAMAPDGRFVVVWGGGSENPYLVFGRRFAADGRPLGPKFPLARSFAGDQSEPDVAMAPDGGFVAVWTQLEGDIWSPDYAFNIYFRRFGADGRPLGPEAVATDGYEQYAPKVAIRPNGDFVIVCEDWSHGALFSVEAQVLSRSGTWLVAPFPVDEDHDGLQNEPAVATAADGTFAVAWTDTAADTDRGANLKDEDSTGVAIRFYTADGTALGPQTLFVNSFLPGAQERPVVSALQNGGFLVLWTSSGGQDGDGSGIFARVYGPTGKPLGRELRINLNRAGHQSSPAISIAPNGMGAAVWSGSDGDRSGIFARLIGIPRP